MTHAYKPLTIVAAWPLPCLEVPAMPKADELNPGALKTEDQGRCYSLCNTARIVGTRSLTAAHFSTYAWAPVSRSASEPNCRGRKPLIRTIFVAGASLPIRGAASIPFIFGMRISSTTTSGRNSATFDRACWPFSASPQTSKCSCWSTEMRRLRAPS